LEFVTIEWCTPLYQESLELRHAVLRQPLGLTFSGEDLDAEHSDLHFGVTEDDKLVGILVARLAGKSTAKLRQMAVDPSRQNQGVGTFLVERVEVELRDRDATEVQLHAREAAVAFYEKLGYRVVGEPYDEVTLPHRKMQKTLPRQN